jgi:hypothetical protein
MTRISSSIFRPYGLQPVEFKATWTRMYNIVKAEAPDTVVVWSPNVGYSYPCITFIPRKRRGKRTNLFHCASNRFGATFADIPSVADQQALDTNGNGQLDGGDDPYSPWYPGDDQVDWIGISLYCESWRHS